MTIADAKPRTLYISRPVLNASDIIAWARSQGFETTLPADDLHVTVAFSRQPVDWMKVGQSWDAEITVPEGGPRLMEQFGAARVLLFTAHELQWRHEMIREAGASWDHPEYQPHITISYAADAPDLADVEPYAGRIVLGPERFAEVKEGWQEGIAEVSDGAGHTFTDAAPLSGVRRTEDGYLVADARVARTGVQEYTRRELGMDGDGTVRLYRPEDEVFSADALKTYAHRPVTLDHPGQVTADNWRGLAVGQTGAEVVRDGEYVRVPMVLMDASAISAVESGRRELSMGYTAQIEMQDGVTPDGEPYDAIQRGLKMNHLAIVAAARGGSKLRIGDGTPEAEEGNMPDTPKLRTVIVDGLSVETTDAGAQAIEKLNKQIADAATAHDQATAAKDAELAKKDARITELETQVVDAAALDKLVQDRAALIEDADKVAGFKIETAGKADADIRKAAVIARLGDKALDGKSDAYVEAMFDALRDGAVSAPKSDAFADAARGGVKTHTEDGWGDKVFARAGVKMKKEG